MTDLINEIKKREGGEKEKERPKKKKSVEDTNYSPLVTQLPVFHLRLRIFYNRQFDTNRTRHPQDSDVFGGEIQSKQACRPSISTAWDKGAGFCYFYDLSILNLWVPR